MHNLTEFIINAGYVIVFLTIFAESGFLLGFFLPGDSLLFTLGIFASQGHLNIWLLLGLCISAAILGDSFGYWMGKYFGPKLFNRQDSFFFKQEYVTKTAAFFEKYGKKTIIMARFVPIVRTFAPIMAGVGKMNYRVFVFFNIIGGFLWAGGLLSVSYVLGSKIPGIEHYLEYIIIGIIAVSFIPIILEFFHKRKK
jgi:membrane-associated protein